MTVANGITTNALTTVGPQDADESATASRTAGIDAAMP